MEVQILSRLLSDPRKNRTGHDAAVVHFRSCLRLVLDDEPNEFRMISGKIPGKRNDKAISFVMSVRAELLRGSGFSRDGEAGNSSACGGSSIADHPPQGIPDLSCSLWRYDLAQLDWLQRTDNLPLFVRDRLDDPRRHQLPAVRDRGHCQRHLQWRDANLVPHRHARDRNLAPRLRWPNQSLDLSWQLDAGALAKSETPNVLVKLLVAHAHSEFGRADIARFDQDILHRQLAVTFVVVQF